MRVSDIRQQFIDKYNRQEFRGNGTVELQAVSFEADELTIFGKRNEEYIAAEIEWYNSKDRSVQKLFDIYGKEVKIWKDVADKWGEVNSNYGWCIHSQARYYQYQEVYHTLKYYKNTRQAVMIYTHPDNELDAIVQMRSNDAVFGYTNDRAWQQYVLAKLAKDLYLIPGKMTWQVGSMHIYERHYHLIGEAHGS